MLRIHSLLMGAAVATAAVAALPAAAAPGTMTDAQAFERGRYIAKIAGCNDCHTPGYAVSGGKVAEKDWLTGDALGWRGDWGTTYAVNLRLYMQDLTEVQWVKAARTIRTRPPMPWFALHDMAEQDLRAFYRFVRHLGPAGQPTPAYMAPGQVPQGPYVQFPGAPK
ncbi:MAG: cytochrome C [Burkholderiales bacterium]|nr:cytochrome C [Burkholderiales bacterium]